MTMRGWLTTAEAIEFTGLSRYALLELVKSHPEVAMRTGPAGSRSFYRWRTIRLAMEVLGLSEERALELVRA
jgi:hypothetical protein